MIIPLVYPISAWSKLANPSFLTPREKKVRQTCSTCHDSEFRLFFACSFSLYGSIISWFVYRFEYPGFPSTWAPAYKIQIMLETVLQCACQWVERNYWKRANFVNSIDTSSVYRFFWAHAQTISWSIYSLLNDCITVTHDAADCTATEAWASYLHSLTRSSNCFRNSIFWSM